MADLLIKITDQDEVDMLNEIALEVNLSTNQYAENIIKSFLNAQIKGRYKEYIDKADVTILKEKLGKYTKLPKDPNFIKNKGNKN